MGIHPISPFISLYLEEIPDVRLSTDPQEGPPFIEYSIDAARRLAAQRNVISSGSLAIDTLLEGGYRTGEIVEIFGESKTGKTQLAIQAVLSAAGSRLGAVFVDTEGTFRPERLAKMSELRGEDSKLILSRVFSIRAETTARQIESVSMMQNDPRVAGNKMLVVDTVSKNFSVEFGGERRLKMRQSLLSIYLNMLARDAVLNNRAVLLTNRVASWPFGGRREVAVGGRSLRRFVTKAIHLTRRGTALDATLMGREDDGGALSCSITEKGFE